MAASGDSDGGRAWSPPAPGEDGRDAIGGARSAPCGEERADGGGAWNEDDAGAARTGRRLGHQRAGLQAVEHVLLEGEKVVRDLAQPCGEAGPLLGRLGQEQRRVAGAFRLAAEALIHRAELPARPDEPRRGGNQVGRSLVQFPGSPDRPLPRAPLGGRHRAEGRGDQPHGGMERPMRAPERTDPRRPPLAPRATPFPA